MLRIRLQRTGRKNRSFFRVVVAEHSNPVKGGYLALIGHYDPLGTEGIQVDETKVAEWIKKGAQPTDTIARLLKGKGSKDMDSYILKMHDRPKKNAPPEEAPKAPVAPAAPAAEAPVPEVAETPAEPEAAPAAETPAPEEAPQA